MHYVYFHTHRPGTSASYIHSPVPHICTHLEAHVTLVYTHIHSFIHEVDTYTDSGKSVAYFLKKKQHLINFFPMNFSLVKQEEKLLCLCISPISLDKLLASCND